MAFKGLSLIGGDSSKLGSANLPYSQKLKIMLHLKELETDYLVVDLGGDTTCKGLDFFLLAAQKIVVSGTEPASVLDSCTLVKVVFNRFLERFFSEHKLLKDLAEQVREGSLEKAKNYSPDFIYQEVRARDPQASVELKKQFVRLRPNWVPPAHSMALNAKEFMLETISVGIPVFPYPLYFFQFKLIL